MADIRRVCIITGANSGIGFETALRMAALDYDVILACRNPRKGNAAVAKIRQQIPECQASFMHLDLASLKSVRSFVDNFHSTGKRLHVLVNNAAVWMSGGDRVPTFTSDGLEMTFGINHIGHFLLTKLLLADLKLSAPDARIVIVGSGIHDPNQFSTGKPPHIDFDNLQLLAPGTFESLLAYKNSKLANMLFMYELSRRLHDTGVSCNAVTPGLVPGTKIFRHQDPFVRCMIACVFGGLCRCCKISRTSSQGANSIVFLATSEKLRGVTGKYFKDCEQYESSVESQDRDIAAKLWTVSEELILSEGKRSP